MALTFRNLLDRLAEMEGTAFASWDESQKRVRVAHVNEALRWAWKTEDRMFAFPFTVDTDTVTPTAGLIDPSDLGDGTWCSVWESDPQAPDAVRCPLEAHVSHEGVRLNRSVSSVFAFFRMPVPQGTYVSESAYASPNDIPDDLLDMVALKALYSLYIGMQQWEAVNALSKSYGSPEKAKGDLVEGLRNSGLVWEGNTIAFTSAVAGMTTLAWFTVTDTYVSVVCPDGETRYLELSDTPP
jgi:hypothetical protein